MHFLISPTLGTNRERIWLMVSLTNCVCFILLRAFMMRTMADCRAVSTPSLQRHPGKCACAYLQNQLAVFLNRLVRLGFFLFRLLDAS